MTIHPTAIVDGQAQLGHNVSIGPYCIVERGAVLGDDCRLETRAVVKQDTHLAAGNHLFEGAVIGGLPQHLQLPARTGSLIVGRNNTFRENSTVHRALNENEATVIGDDNLIMINVHIAHDCQIGNQVVLINNVMIAGHVTIQDRAYVAGGAAVQQFRRIGRLAAVGGYGRATKDVPPFVTLDGFTSGVVGLNLVGLRRAGYNSEDITRLKNAYRLIYRSGQPWNDILSQLRTEFDSGPAAEFYPFFSSGKYGFMPERRTPEAATIKLFRERRTDAEPQTKAG